MRNAETDGVSPGGVSRAGNRDRPETDPGPVRALVSVHDVMPETRPSVERLLGRLESLGVAPVTLLVVPGAGWSGAGIGWLRTLESRGYILAGHGWRHRVERIGGVLHRLHSRLISRNVAEHLALDADGIQDLLERCYAWFIEHDLSAPTLYCPPAWAMGRIPHRRLATLSFRHYELFSGILTARSGRLQAIPLTGYEADTPHRAPIIRLWNHLNRRRAARLGWLRIGIHPHDLDLALAEDLLRDLARYRRSTAYAALDAA